jgi:hypothetical protein
MSDNEKIVDRIERPINEGQRKGQDILDRNPVQPERQPTSGQNPPPVVVPDVND